ncbi:MAG: YabP/YqfC family sporulation protein [Clostridia bacterium]|nr:YabP/YqfC family sporulation protein [Clostridia bacterium]
MFENFFASLGLDCELSPCKYRYSVYGRSGGIFEGVKIESYTPSEIIFSFSGGKLAVTGKNMAVKKYFESEVALSGEICGVELK